MVSRQFGEVLARQVAKKNELNIHNTIKQFYLLDRLKNAGLIEAQIAHLFHFIREKGNDAVHNGVGTYDTALTNLEYAYRLGVWYCQTFGQNKDLHVPPFIIASDLDKTYLLEYEKAVAQLSIAIANYKSLDLDLLNLPTKVASLHQRKKSLYIEISHSKDKFKQRQRQEKHNYLVKKQQLLNSQRKLELNQIRIEMELSDLQGFECDAEIRILITGISRKKAMQRGHAAQGVSPDRLRLGRFASVPLLGVTCGQVLCPQRVAQIVVRRLGRICVRSDTEAKPQSLLRRRWRKAPFNKGSSRM